MEFDDSSYPTPRGLVGTHGAQPAPPDSTDVWFRRTGSGAVGEEYGSIPFADTLYRDGQTGAGNLWPSSFPQWQDVRYSPPASDQGNYRCDNLVSTYCDAVPYNTTGSGQVSLRWGVYESFSGVYASGAKPIVFTTPVSLTLGFEATRIYTNQSNVTVTDVTTVTHGITIPPGAYGGRPAISGQVVGDVFRIFPDVTPKSGTSVAWTFAPVSVS